MSYRNRQGGGPPSWFTFILGVAFVFGGFYLWTNFQDFMRTGGISVCEATAISLNSATSTAIRDVTAAAELPTRRPTATPKPPCREFIVSATNGIVRQAASTTSRLLDSLTQGTRICVLEELIGDDGFTWYFVDRDEITRFIEPGYMREDVIDAVNPTPTASNTALPAPTITLTYTPTATITPESNQDTSATQSQVTSPASVTPTAQPTETPYRVQI